jgi:hypothetical protein
MRTQLVATAADVISRAMQQGRTLPAALAVALDSAQLLQSPDTAAAFEKLLRWHDEDGKAIEAATRLRGELRSRITTLEADREASDREYEAATARIAELEASPLGWARLLDAKSLDNFMCALGMAADTDPADGALSQVEEMIRSFRAAVSPEAEQERTQSLHDHIVARDAEIERLNSRVAELEAAAVAGRAALADLTRDHEDPGTAALGALYLLQQATFGTPMQPGETVPKVYRPTHDSIVMGLYLTAAEARKHCETEMRRDLPTVVLDWIEDEEDDVAELVASVGEDERVTGYVVDALEIAAEYDEEADA